MTHNNGVSLGEYKRKRKFDQTPEPAATAKAAAGKGHLRFVVQKHAASRDHYDFRLEFGGAFKSWAVPKGPSLTSQDPRLAVAVEDHPLAYGNFEGTIPKGNYGAGTVMIWDKGTLVERNCQGRKDSEAALIKGLAKGHLTFILSGQKLRGEFALVKLKSKRAEENAWLLIKKQDAEATRKNILLADKSVVSQRSMQQIAAQAKKKGQIWLPGKGLQPKTKPLAASRSKLPHRLKPMEPMFAAQMPAGDSWWFETFGRGYRALAEVEKSQVKLYSKSLLPFDKKYPKITAALRKISHQVIMDGEIIGRGDNAQFEVTDLLYLDGHDLRVLPLVQRRQKLEAIKLPKPLQLAFWSQDIGKLKLVGRSNTVVGKQGGSIYQSGISKLWLRFRLQWSSPISQKISSDKPPLTHLKKIFWPQEKYTKGDLIAYYDQMAETLLPYIVDRPQSLHRQPNGISGEGFFHKDMSSFLPSRLETERIFSASGGKTVNYVLCQDRWSLLYLVNLGCIELNPWLSRRGSLDHPDMVVIDLDPHGNKFSDVVKVAQLVHKILDSVGANSYCKTSGSSGLHICIPSDGKATYETARVFAEQVCRQALLKLPKLTSMERNPAKRRGRIYLDFLQNRRGQTLAAVYCVRPRPKATVSAPLKWSEVKVGLNPEAFTIKTMAGRLKKVGDLWKPMSRSKDAVNIEVCLRQLLKAHHN